ncbi:DNA-binding transcriptional regulator DicC [compost metagenome]
MRTEEAVEVFGSQKALADAIGISPSAVYQWGSEVPASRIKSVNLAIQARAVELEEEAARLRERTQK